MNHREIERISVGKNFDFQKDVFPAYKPVILENSFGTWPALKRWNVDYLNAKIANAEVSYKHSGSHLHPNFCDPKCHPRKHNKTITTFNNYIQLLIEDTKKASTYLASGDDLCFK